MTIYFKSTWLLTVLIAVVLASGPIGIAADVHNPKAVAAVDKSDLNDDGEVTGEDLFLFSHNYLQYNPVNVDWCLFYESTMAGVEFIASERLGEFFAPEQLKRLPESATRFDIKAQDRLARYIFEKQIELRNKGLL